MYLDLQRKCDSEKSKSLIKNYQFILDFLEFKGELEIPKGLALKSLHFCGRKIGELLGEYVYRVIEQGSQSYDLVKELHQFQKSENQLDKFTHHILERVDFRNHKKRFF